MPHSPLAAGTYHGLLTEANMDTNKNGNGFIALTFTLDYWHDGTEWVKVNAGVQRDVKLYLTDAAWEWSVEKLKGIGFNGSFKLPDFPADIKDKGMNLTCEHQEDGGKTYENWDLADWGTQRARKAPEDAALDEMSLRYKAMTEDSPAPPPPPPGGLPPAADADPGGIPF